MVQQTERGVRVEQGIKVNVTERYPGPDYRLDVSAEDSGAVILMAKLTPEVIRRLRGDGPLNTCAAVYHMMEDCLRDFGYDGADDFINRVDGESA